MLRRYRTLNNETEVNVDGARIRAGDDGVFVVEAGSRAEDVLIAGGAISAHLFSLLFDDAGNLIANVNHRTGALGDSSTGLLSLSGGLGEVSVDDALKAIVLHTGVAGAARAIYRNGLVGMYGGGGSATNVPSGATGLPVSMAGIDVDPQGLLTATPSEFLAPATTDRRALIVASGVAYFGLGTDSGAGTTRSITLQVDNTGAGGWADVSDGVASVGQGVAPSAGLSFLRFSISGLLYAGGAPVGTKTAKFRLLVKQDSGAAMTVTVTQLNLAVYRD